MPQVSPLPILLGLSVDDAPEERATFHLERCGSLESLTHLLRVELNAVARPPDFNGESRDASIGIFSRRDLPTVSQGRQSKPVPWRVAFFLEISNARQKITLSVPNHAPHTKYV